MKVSLLAFFSVLGFGFVRGEDRPPEVETLMPGVRLTLVAEHPDLATPTGVDVDEKGNVWLICCHTHMPPDDYPGPKLDEVVVFGADGTRRVFYRKTYHTMDLELGPDGWVYLAERSRILRVRDSDGDGAGDVEESLATLDTESDYPHNGLSALAWHPDGDLCFGLGENFAKAWVLTGRDGTKYSGYGEGGIFRMRPDGMKLHRIARGMWNPFGLCVREDGVIFAGENDPGEQPPCRLLHIVEGGDYGYQRLYGPEPHHPFVCWNGELRGTLPMIHPSGEAPCGVTPLGRGVMVPSWSDHRIDFFPLKPKGASYTAGRIALVRGGRYFRPVCIAPVRAPGGTDQLTWYLTDWVDGRYQAHGYGRLWKLQIAPKAAAGWMGPAGLEPPTNEARLAEELRNGEGDFSQDQLLGYARADDPFLARAALMALARQAAGWKPAEVKGWPAADRVSAVLALKLSGADPVPWAPVFLSDADSAVQFETLRWIGDGRLESLLPQVESVLGRREIDFRVFEAAVAARNILTGKPEAGVRDPDLLLSQVRDPEKSPAVRAWALRLLPAPSRAALKEGQLAVTTFPKGLTAGLLRELLDVGDETLSMEVVRVLSGNLVAGETLLREVASDPARLADLRAEAVAGLGAVADKHEDLLVKLATDSTGPIRAEALRCLRAMTLSPASRDALPSLAEADAEAKELLGALLTPEALVVGRPALTDTAGWLRRIDAVPGTPDPDSGRRIFHHARLALCSNCHRFNGCGNVVGPDLSVVAGRGDRRWLLESILNPNAEIAPEFLPRMITLKDGTTFTGIRLRSSTAEALRDTNGRTRSFQVDDIESIQELEMSLMPPGLPLSLTDRELRDLLALLESGGKE